ncbi:MAG: ral secretion pathway protein [Pseudomonadota bacterium]|nr:ral secretion pathway protein [Pseudomonadota bacterium]
MYQQHFSLNELPFSIAPDPRYLYMSERHREALAHLLYGLKSSGAFILLTGDVGTGKTTVSRCLLEQIPRNTRLALVLNPMMSALELLQSVCDELHIERPAQQDSIKAHVDAISRDLLAAHARGENTVVLIDEAQNLAADVLEQLRLLTNLETAERKLLQIILLGQPELREQLAQPSMSQLSQRITARYHLEPLNLAETRAYVQHRLLVAGCREPLFGNASLRRLHQLSNGVPRLVNVLCDRALLGAYVQNKSQANVAILNRAADEVFGARPDHQRVRVALLGLLLALLVTLVWFNYGYEKPVVVEPLAEEIPPPAEALPSPPPPPPAVVATPVVTSQIIWPDADHALRSYVLAFQSLFTLWQFDYQPEQHGTPCFFAQLNALDCLTETGDMDRLYAYNRPVILKLYDANGDALFATLLAVIDETAVLDLAGTKQHLPVAGLQDYWRGEFILLWQRPPGYTGMMHVGYSGTDVLWLRQKFSQMNPAVPLVESGEYDALLAEQVKQFQLEQGLLADGVAGVQTLIHLNEASGAVEPKLVQLAEGQD